MTKPETTATIIIDLLAHLRDLNPQPARPQLVVIKGGAS